ncbi:lysine methyltransferase METTL21D isoform X1 [Micractinium conductrix]|uniref:Lysine methyltransferase METTL21D isoform X1 n=1 Tax=Micractinium conductrix TaxID=554055 RepID=A0A2P6V8H3_9CHLO|nr:lysine methyltransferase METTL21D isoform X1 [Micractinium conductrix]|eukprot:PSC70389.1 lysine methyltransferase METTL21D isoform X1 [Micractinium conductrix]
MLERWNTHFSTTVQQELFGIELQLAQDPNSNNLGTTVWDASIVLAKYIEKNSRRGDFSRQRVRGKRALELGAGMGLAGMALALLGCDVAFTDIGDVLPLLRHNVHSNISQAALKLKDAAWAAAEVGGTLVTSLDWADRAAYADPAFKPPYDFILAADCVYSELAVPHLLATVLAMGGPRTQTIVTNEFRSQTVHDEFMLQFGRHFAIRKVPANKQDQNYQHTLIHIYLLKRRKVPLGEEGAAGEAAGDAAGEETAEGAAEGAAGVAAEGAAEDAGDGEAEAAGAAQRVAMAAGGSLGEAAAAASEAAAGAGAASDAGAAPAGEAEAAQRSSELFQARRQGNALVRALAEVQL